VQAETISKELPDPRGIFFRWTLHHVRKGGLIVAGGIVDGGFGIEDARREIDTIWPQKDGEERPVTPKIVDFSNLGVDPEQADLLFLEGKSLQNSDVEQFVRIAATHGPSIGVILSPEDGPDILAEAERVGQFLTTHPTTPYASIEMDDMFVTSEGFTHQFYLPQTPSSR
jgi:hypothetical protein